jgi:hypothetical protein
MKTLSPIRKNIIFYKAVSKEEPVSKPISKCKKKTISLQFFCEKDKKFIKSGKISLLRKKKILEFCKEAFFKGALLTQEDLALLILTSISTIKRDIFDLNQEGFAIPTRGFIKDIGRGISFKSKIIELHKKGVSINKIAAILWHSEIIIRQTIDEYQKVVDLYHRNIPIKNIHILTNISIKLIKEYLEI